MSALKKDAADKFDRRLPESMRLEWGPDDLLPHITEMPDGSYKLLIKSHDEDVPDYEDEVVLEGEDQLEGANFK